ncbi:MAG: ERCC4 domain-containing protein [Nanoarchaeota archaeon]|nr:ERCC4 domain-containing protein [Nanoarchaeota archaeon]
MEQALDIFSNKKESESEKQKVIVDYREKNSLVISELISLGLDVETTHLKVADYIVKGVAIERKTVSDFISSMISKRLSNQLEELGQYKERLLIIEGIYEQEIYTDSEEPGRMHPNSIRGFLISILLKHNVPIIFTKDYKDTARFISVISKRKPQEAPLNVGKKTLDKKERLQFILEGFPGVGPKTAKKLLERFGTIKNIINASEEELKEILGKKAELTKGIIEEEY